MNIPKTDIPGLIRKHKAEGSRVAFLPADLDSQFDNRNFRTMGTSWQISFAGRLWMIFHLLSKVLVMWIVTCINNQVALSYILQT